MATTVGIHLTIDALNAKRNMDARLLKKNDMCVMDVLLHVIKDILIIMFPPILEDSVNAQLLIMDAD